MTDAWSGTVCGFYCIDYHLAAPAIASTAREVAIYKTEKFSDHAPITVGYDLAI